MGWKSTEYLLLTVPKDLLLAYVATNRFRFQTQWRSVAG